MMKTKKSMLSLCATGVVAAVLGLTMNSAYSRDLTVVSWGGASQAAQKKIFFDGFAKESGHPVLDEAWDGGIGILQSKVKAGNPSWDVVSVEAEELALGCFDGLFEKIDWAKVGNKEDFIPGAVSECGVGSAVWSMVLAYDGAKYPAGGPSSWADFWDTQKFPGKRSLRKGPKYTLEFALLADGVKAADVYKVLATPEGVDRAFKKLDALKPNIVWWESGAQPLQLLATGEVAMTTSYNGRITSINETEKRDFRIVWPGSVYAVDSWVILKGSENKDAAMDFIAFASKPELMAQIPEFYTYGLPNKVAAAEVPDRFKPNLPTTSSNLEGAIALDASFWIDNSEALTQRFNALIAQ